MIMIKTTFHEDHYWNLGVLWGCKCQNLKSILSQLPYTSISDVAEIDHDEEEDNYDEEAVNEY